MTNRLMTSAAILAFVCSTALLSPAFAQDEGTGEEPGTELTDPMPGEDIGGGEVTIDDGVLNDGDGEIAVEDGEPVPYGPEDCIDCNVAPTMVELDGGDRPLGENFRDNSGGDSGDSITTGGKRVLGAIARVEGADTLCDIGDVVNAAKVCP
jgi:hypothetical protein